MSTDRARATWPRVTLGGAPADLLSQRDALDLILARAEQPDGAALGVMSLNLDHLHHFPHGVDAGFAWLGDGGEGPGLRWLALLDGAPLVSRANALTGRQWPRLSGSDLIGPILHSAESRGLSVGVVGGTPETHALLRSRLAETHPGLRVVGYWAPERPLFTDRAASAELVRQIATAGPQILVFSLAKGMQERWMETYGEATGARVLLAFGAATDFLAGKVRRAPAWFSEHGLEWAWRLTREPRRLARRYLVQGPGEYLMLRLHSRVLPDGGAR